SCRLNFLVEYPIFEKIDVNGENEEPLYAYLKQEQPFTEITGKGATKLKLVLKAMDRHYKDNNDIKWNFTKFLVDREGNVVRRFEPTEDLGDVKAAIKDLL
ncbi:MAG: glutathione peroxidase, partial [Methanobrevibacter sp.]|nr:glutathione peroxidase [Methanobrevibacter sp.]